MAGIGAADVEIVGVADVPRIPVVQHPGKSTSLEII
jgi:hypothetical protein